MILVRFNGRSDNFGDVLIFSNLYEQLKRHDTVHLLGPSVPGIEAKRLRLRGALTLAFRTRVLKREPVILVEPPGARFTPKEAPRIGPFKRLKKKAVATLWNWMGVKICVTGISVDSEVYKSKYKHYSKIGVRDYSSLRKLKNAGFDADFCPDMACLVTPRFPEWSRQDVLISLRKESPDNGYASGYDEALRRVLPTTMEALKATETEFVFYAQVVEDEAFNRALAAEAQGFPNSRYLEYFPTLSNYRDVFKEYKYVISNRLHVLLPAMSEGAIPIALISKTHSKILNLMTSYGLEKNIVFVDSGESVEQQVQQLLKHAETLRDKNYRVLIELNAQAKDYIKSMVAH